MLDNEPNHSGGLRVSGLCKYGDGIGMRAMTLEEHYVTPGFWEGPGREFHEFNILN